MKHIVLTILLLLSITGSSQVTDEEWLVDYLGYNLIEITTYEMEIGISPECFLPYLSVVISICIKTDIII